ncbi:MAG TPA: dipeptidase [Candidatus Kryptobacter bacterium]|nr:dipeptidase [Candidatus Kryptobacter bacterium]
MDYLKLSALVDSHEKKYLDELGAILRIESISADPSKKGEMIRCAETVSIMMRAAGMENVQLFETEGNQLVYGDNLHAEGKPTVLVYGHYDVQPVDPLSEWETPPFEPVVRGTGLFARGSSDDKGQLFIHIKAFEVYKRLFEALPINLKYIFEGEEEIGSIHLEPFIRSHRELLGADAVVISDTAMYGRDMPTICYGLRGMAYVELTVENATIDLHSGSFGGAVENPVHVLAGLISRFHDESGRITVPHFYDDVLEVSKEERAEIAALPYSDEEFLRQSGALAPYGESGYTTNERLWIRPTLDVNGIYGGFTGEGAKTIIPAKATAKISMRLVPNQKSAKILDLFEEHIREIAPRTVKVTVRKMHSGEPALTPIGHPVVKAASAALEQVFGRKPYYIREGGSIPEVLTFQEALGAPVVLLGFGLPDENSHAPNEHLYLRHFFDGIKTVAMLYEKLGQI